MIESLFPQILLVHVTTATLLIALVVAADFQGLLWVLGKREVLNGKKLRQLHRCIWYGLGIMVVTGLLLFYPFKEFLLHFTPFLAKMGFVAALIINGLFMASHIDIVSTTPFRETDRKTRMVLLGAAVISTISWIGAFVMAQFLGLS